MVRYLAMIGETKREVLNKEVWTLDTKQPDVPYIKLKIKVIKIETKFDHERKKRRIKNRRDNSIV